MSYILDTLVKGELIEHESKVSAMAYLPHIVLGFIFTPFFGIGLLFLIYVAVIVKTSEMAVTTKRVVAKTGFISRNAVEIPLAKIESVNINQSVFGRLFGYGDVIVTGTGSNATPFKNIADPMAMKIAATKAVDGLQTNR